MADEETKVQPRGTRIIGLQECPRIYANLGSVMSTPFDVQIVFADLEEIGPEGIAQARALARVIMTPEHAALLAQALQRRVEHYVQQYGKLRGIGVEVGPTESAGSAE